MLHGRLKARVCLLLGDRDQTSQCGSCYDPAEVCSVLSPVPPTDGTGHMARRPLTDSTHTHAHTDAHTINKSHTNNRATHNQSDAIGQTYTTHSTRNEQRRAELTRPSQHGSRPITLTIAQPTQNTHRPRIPAHTSAGTQGTEMVGKALHAGKPAHHLSCIYPTLNKQHCTRMLSPVLTNGRKGCRATASDTACKAVPWLNTDACAGEQAVAGLALQSTCLHPTHKHPDNRLRQTGSCL